MIDRNAMRRPFWGGLCALTLVHCGQRPKPAARGEPPPSRAQLVAASGAQRCPAGMQEIPPGTFSKGKAGELRAGPSFAVTFDKPFCIDRTEVTVADYAKCMGEGVCTKPRVTLYCNHLGSDDPPNVTQHPQNCVDYVQSEAYCRWIGKRLPSEAEWEYAARGSDGRKYPWGNEEPDATRLRWSGAGERNFSTAPVGTYPRDVSAFGVLDMGGNVAEWVAFEEWRTAEDEGLDPRAGLLKGSSWDNGFEPEPAWRRCVIDRSGELGQSSSAGIRCAAPTR